MVHHGEDAGGRAAAHGDRRLDLGQGLVRRGRGQFAGRVLDGQGQVDPDLAAVQVLVEDHAVTRRRDERWDAEPIKLLGQLIDHGSDVPRAVPWRRCGERHHARGRNRLGGDVVGRHLPLFLDVAKSCLDRQQLVLVRLELLFQLSAPEHEHAAELSHGDPGEELLGLRERKPQLLQREDPVEPPKLVRRVAAVTGLWIDPRRVQQSDLVVVPQRADRHGAEPGELADAEHETSMHPSRNGRVKPVARQILPGPPSKAARK